MKHIFTLTLTLLLVALKGFSQAPVQQAKNFELDIPMSWNASYEAKELITLKKGFSFTSNNKSKFSAKINASIDSPVDGGNGNITQGLTTGYTGPGGPTDAPPGAMPFQIDVNPIGGANGNLPFELPAGFAGITPQLGLAYSNISQLGNFGMGCSLSGISTITRTGQNYYFDANVTGITYTNSDRFELDGQRLMVKTGANGANLATYATENDNFCTITSNGTAYSAPDYFSVVTKDGTEMLYGYSDAKALVVTPFLSAATLTWPIKKITDKRGNSIEFNYSNPTNGQVKLTSINYTANSNAGISAQYSISINYQEYSDPKYPYLGGRMLKNSLYITQLKVTELATGTELNRYDFNYTNNKLSEINKYYKGKLVCKPTNFVWNQPTELETLKQYSEWEGPDANYFNENYESIVGDFDGNGVNDILKISRTSDRKWMLLTNNNGVLTEKKSGTLPELSLKNISQTVTIDKRVAISWSQVGISIPLPKSLIKVSSTQSSVSSYALPYTFIDIDQDGALELCLVVANKNLDPTSYYFKAYKVSTNGLTLKSAYTKAIVGDINYDNILLNGDFTGNGTIDVVAFKPDAVSMNSNNIIDFSAVSYTSSFSVCEFNGDSKTELLAVGDNSVAVYAPVYSSSSGKHVMTPIASITGIGAQDVLINDYNGDGLTDVLLYDSYSSKWKLYFSNGSNGFIIQSDDKLTAMNNGRYAAEIYICNPPISISASPDELYFEYSSDKLNGSENDKRAFCNKYFTLDVNADGVSEVVRVERDTWFDSAYKRNSRYNIRIFSYKGGNFNNETIYKGPLFTQGLTDISATCDLRGDISKIGCMEYKFNTYGMQNNMSVGDYNNDGYPELIFQTQQNIKVIDNSNPNGIVKTSLGTSLQFNQGKPAWFLASTTNGMGVTTTLQYAKLVQGINYSQSTTAELPSSVHEGIMPLYVVNSKIVTASGLNLSNTVYSYAGLRIQDQLGILGFKIVAATDAITKQKTVTTFDVAPTYFVPYISQLQNYYNSVLTGTNQYIYTFATRSTAKCFYQYMKQSTSTNVLTGNVITTDFTMDEMLGNLTKKLETYGSNGTIETQFSLYTSMGKPRQLITTRNQNGAFSTTNAFTYDAFGNVLTHTDNDGYATTYTYNGDHTTIATLRDATMGTTTTFTYNSKGRVTRKETPIYGKNYIETYTYNTDGNVTRSTDKNGLITLYFYDAYGHLSAEVLPNGIRKAHTYGWGTSAEVYYTAYYKQTTDDAGNVAKTYFDRIGRQLSQESTPAGGIKAIANTYFNPDGSVSSESSSVTGTTSYTYKTDGRLAGISALGKTTTYDYSYGTTTATTNGISSSKTINSFGQLVKANDAGGEISYIYHASGNPETIRTNGSTVTITYDAKGRQTSLTDPDAGTNTYIYNSLGQLTNMTDGNGNTTTNTYDPLGRTLTTSTIAGAGVAGTTRTLTYVYDPDNQHLGFLKKVTDVESGISTNYAYDRLGRTTSVSEVIKGVAYTFNYEYDAQGKVTRMVYPDGYAIAQSYKGNYIDKIRDEKAGVDLFSAYTYNKWGQVLGYTQGNGNTVSNTYDTYGNIDNNTFGPSINRIKYDYSFEAASGMLTNRSKQYLKSGGSLHTDAFTYDNLYRLTGWTVSQTNQSNVVYSMAYLNNGNLVQKSDIGYYGYDATKTHAVTSVSQLSGDEFSTKYNEVNYNAFNSVANIKLSASEGATVTNTYTLTYGPDNQRRISNSDGAETIYTGLYEVRSNGDRLHYIPTPDGLCGLIVTNGATQTNYYLHNDHLGSLVAAEAQDGTLTEFSYDPWGRRRKPTNWNDYAVTAPTLFTRGFTGHEHMDAYGLINMNGRVYDPRLGRMLSPDNYVQAPGYTQSYNRYSYCMNNPLMFTDPSGNYWQRMDPNEGIPCGNSYDDNGNRIPKGGNQYTNNFGRYMYQPGSLAAKPYSYSYTTGTLVYVNLFEDGRLYYSGWEISVINTTVNIPAQAGGGASGSWGDESFFGDEGFGIKALNWILAGGPIHDGPYYGGIAPVPVIGRIGSYAEMAKLTRGSKGAIQAHHLVEARHLKTLGLSTKEAPAIILERTTHQGVTNALRTEMPFGTNSVYTTEQMLNGYQNVYTDPAWLSIVKAVLGY